MTSAYDSALIDVELIEDPKLLTLPRSYRLVHVEAMVWSKARLTDGFIPAGSLRRLTDEVDAEQAAAELVRVGLWRMSAEGWHIVGFTDTQMDAATVRGLRAASRRRWRRWKDRQDTKSANAKPRSENDSSTNGAANAFANGAANESALLPAGLPATAEAGKAGGGNGAEARAAPAAAHRGVLLTPIPPTPTKDADYYRARASSRDPLIRAHATEVLRQLEAGPHDSSAPAFSARVRDS